MKGHKLVADNHDHFVVENGKGTQFKVAKNGLSAPMVGEIAKLPRVTHAADGTIAEEGDGNDMMGGESPAALQDKMRIASHPDEKIDVRDDAPKSITTPDQPPSTEPDAAPVGQQVYPTPDGKAPGTSEAPTPASLAPTGPDLAGQYLSDMTSASNAEKAANNARAEAEGKVSDATADAANNYMGQQAAANDAYQTKLAELNGRSDALFQDVASTKIDPNHLWSSASAGSKLSMLAGILVSGFGANAGQGNMALNVINKAIDNDIDAQKTNLNTKQNLLHYNLQRTQDLTAAQAETRLNLLATFKGQVARAAAKQGSAISKANADGLNAQIDAQMAGIKHEVATQRAMLSMAQGQGSAAAGADPNDIDPTRLRTSLLLGQQGFPNGIPKERAAQAMKEFGAFKRQQGVSDTLAQQFQVMDENHGLGIGGGPLASEAKKRYDAASNITMTTVDHELAGRVTETTLNALKDANTPRWGDAPETRAIKLRAIDDAIKAANAKDADGYGTLMTYGLLSPNNPHIAPSAHILKQTRSR